MSLFNLKIISYKNIFYFFLWSFGVCYWYYFCIYGPPSQVYLDWYLQNVFLNIFKEGIHDNKIPWFYSPSIYHGNHFFLANPEITITPDIFLLKYIENNFFIFIHIVIFFTIGFFGIKKIGKELSLFSFFFFYLLFFFNGFIMIRLESGWFQYIGIFILPYILLTISKMGNQELNFRKDLKNIFNFRFFKNKMFFKLPIKLGLLLSLLMFNGSYHLVIWIILFFTIVLISNKNFFWEYIFSISIFVLISMFRIFPGILIFRSPSGFLTGYPDVMVLFDSLIFKNPDIDVLIDGVKWGPLEFQAYIGPIIFLLFLFALFNFNILKKHYMFRKEFLFASLIILLFSYGSNYEIIHQLPLLFTKAERISTRFIIIPLYFLILISIYFLDYLYKNKNFKLVLFYFAPIVIYDYLDISLNYSKNKIYFQDNIERSIISENLLPPSEVFDFSVYELYKFLTLMSFCISIFFLLVFLNIYVKLKVRVSPIKLN